jgi:hypothetical protein
MMPCWRVLGLVVCVLAWPSGVAEAAAPGGQDTPSMLTYQPPKVKRRDGFMVGVSLGAGLAGYAGYPNVAGQIGDPNYLSQSGPLFGYAVTFWGGGALRDWLTVGLGASIASAGAGSTQGGISSAILHLEVYPFFPWGGPYQDLGFAFDGGLGGGALLQTASSPDPLGAGSTSHVALTAFYEPLRFGPFSAGPTLTYAHDFSMTMQVSQATLGLRCTGYSHQPKKTTQTAKGFLAGLF